MRFPYSIIYNVYTISSDADYTIFVWRQQQISSRSQSLSTLHLQNPSEPLPTPPAYQNPSFYVFHSSRPHSNQFHATSSSPRPRSSKSHGSKRSAGQETELTDCVPAFKKEFQKFHSENGVRTVMGTIGPVTQGLSHDTFFLCSDLTPSSL